MQNRTNSLYVCDLPDLKFQFIIGVGGSFRWHRNNSHGFLLVLRIVVVSVFFVFFQRRNEVFFYKTYRFTVISVRFLLPSGCNPSITLMIFYASSYRILNLISELSIGGMGVQ